jgi:adenylate cyclase
LNRQESIPARSNSIVKALAVAGCALLAAWLALFASNASTLFNGWDDLRWRLLPEKEGSRLFLIDIDEQSLASHGRWPWPRETLAELLGKLVTGHQAALVGVDIILSEAASADADSALAALDKDRIIWAHAASLANEPHVNQGVLTVSPPCPPDNPWHTEVNGWLGLTSGIAGSSFRAGHIRPWPDSDQVVRSYQPFLPNQGNCIPALGLAMYAALLDLPLDSPLVYQNGAWHWGGIPLGLERSGQLRLIWRQDTIAAIPAHEILAGTARLPANGVMVVGSSAVGIGDFVSIPGADRFPGAGIHALAMRQWLDRDFVMQPKHHDLLIWGMLAPVFVILWMTSRKAAMIPWLTATGIFIAWNFCAWLLWRKSIYLAVEPMLWSLLCLPLLQGIRLWQEKNTSRRIYQQFHAYVPEKVLQELIRSKVDPRQLQAESREITILFADLRGFTSLSENMPSEAVVALLNETMDYLCKHISALDGTLDKFMGDGLMAFWGSPVAMADHADRAVACARAMLDNLDQLNDRLRQQGMPAVSLGIGINSGEVAVGNMGSASRRNYSAVGDAVNTAARLQQFCKTLACNLLVGADTAALCKNQELVELDTVELRGKRNRVTVFTCAGYR